MQNNIPKQVLKGLRDLVSETAEKTVEETGKIVTGVITGGELLGDLRPMSEEQTMRKKMEEENLRQEELKKVREQMGVGRNVEAEIKQVIDEKEQKEKEEERLFLEQIRQQREAEQAERQQMETGSSSNPSKQKKSRGSAFAKGKKKSQPQMDQMSSTSEFKGKVD